jgi:chromosome segregation ATPase
MNKSYLIVPVILLAIFGFSYNGALKDMQAKEDANHAKAAAKKAEDDKHKAEVEAKATADAKKHQEERDAEDRKKQEKKQADYDDAMKKLRDEANDYVAQAEKFGKEAADLELQISQGRNEKERLTRETLELAKAVELAKISRRNAELEIQRMVDMVGKKLNDSSIATPPPPPPLPANK